MELVFGWTQVSYARDGTDLIYEIHQAITQNLQAPQEVVE